MLLLLYSHLHATCHVPPALPYTLVPALHPLPRPAMPGPPLLLKVGSQIPAAASGRCTAAVAAVAGVQQQQQ